VVVVSLLGFAVGFLLGGVVDLMVVAMDGFTVGLKEGRYGDFELLMVGAKDEEYEGADSVE